MSDNDNIEKIEKSEADWKAELTPEQYTILRQKGTERAWTGVYNDFKGNGTFHCAGCGAALFDAATKFDSGSGWPSFYDMIDPTAVKEIRDVSHGMIRTEVVCAKCDGHLGHVFPDGPKPTGQRYCINSISIVHEGDK
ncbi:MAG: peptide-methionine (R)-S-oxide reductase MsrB [Rhodospirillaceae bacterium]